MRVYFCCGQKQAAGQPGEGTSNLSLFAVGRLVESEEDPTTIDRDKDRNKYLYNEVFFKQPYKLKSLQ